ncbi:[FeFe] hydrogenase H-cluster radical SAM maturase HydG [Rhodovastum atsumiense]|uniref:[FeFe] hydrogenase H-cluster radical SAM maturase HydG n=1 Tax=Rhodovastum atsumiense TaxID=504468 RepID=A0A5M6IWA5_9PROT|nr:[FeFe] hydrogenase H-cluster radical SAM maturase HydG [Rhodovastum atsumiense]KAA5612604.1 [FeFe] hydrogenase H-cluster radical SAM maturase HydG [Rhodovastum atsumiense]CAH2601297.1 [FeFe] hydrogenase H-cluster radical SAM maturase HydG [Rhodovastum atsumiense]
MKQQSPIDWIDEAAIAGALGSPARDDPGQVRAILDKARTLTGLGLAEVAVLSTVTSPDLLAEVFDAARTVKDEIYGRRVVLFAPLYFSNICQNECVYCAFRKNNHELSRRFLTLEEVAQETAALVEQGHKRLLLIAGEAFPGKGFSYLLDAIATIYGVHRDRGEIRRINVNVAPLTVEEFRALKAAGIGTYQLFQETYHRPTYAEVHVAGPKTDFAWRVSAMDRAMEAGIDDVGLGVLFGLYDWRFEILALMQHIAHLEQCFGVGCHTISVPRIEPAVGSAMSEAPPYAVSDDDFRKLIAILRLAVPYTGMIMSTRETPAMRRESLLLGISQISGGSRTNPGGYTETDAEDASQFQRGDHRSLDEVVHDVAEAGFLPSFCTACYRRGRTGKDFMDMAKPGLIREMCGPNGLSTFVEYLEDYASPATVRAGNQAIQAELERMPEKIRHYSETMIRKVHEGKRDVFR